MEERSQREEEEDRGPLPRRARRPKTSPKIMEADEKKPLARRYHRAERGEFTACQAKQETFGEETEKEERKESFWSG